MNKIEGLLKWCQNQLSEYPNISIQNFSTSWKNGLAFNALIHKFKPDLINYHGLDSSQVFYNNYKAFKIAEIHFGIPSLLDAKDIEMCESPERLSIITYVSQFYNCLKEMKPEGGYKINRFKNTNNGNSDFENISSRASINRLSKMTCSICFEKVYLLERYIADDKLFHRKCYRTHQIQNIDNEPEIIGDFLNIYGEINPKLNSNIYVHPIQDFYSDNQMVDVQTSSPVNFDNESDIEDSENLSESLSSYDNSERLSYYNSDENNSIHNHNEDALDNWVVGGHMNNISMREKIPNLKSQDNSNIIEKESDINFVDTEMIIDVKESLHKDLNSNSMERIEVTDRKIQNNISIIDKIEQKEQPTIDLSMTNSEKKLEEELEEELEKESEEQELGFYNKISQLTGISHQVDSNIKEPIKNEPGRRTVRLRSQENLVVSINEISPIKPVKQRLYVKKRDKKLPYSTFFEVSHDKCVQAQFLNPNKITCTVREFESEEISNKFHNKLPEIAHENQKVSDMPAVSDQSKKLIKFNDNTEVEYESDVSSIEDEEYDCIKPRITRNSIWRKPIISSTITKMHKSTCVPIEGKFRDYAEFKERLEELNAKQSDIEIKARNIQQKLWKEKADTPLYDTLLVKWLDLVEEKDRIFYEENALYSWIKDLKLQEMKLKLETQIRLLPSTNSNDPNIIEKENELVAKLIETVNKRAELVDAMHEENIRRLEIIKSRGELDNAASSSPDNSSINQQLKHDKNHKRFWKRKTSLL